MKDIEAEDIINSYLYLFETVYMQKSPYTFSFADNSKRIRGFGWYVLQSNDSGEKHNFTESYIKGKIKQFKDFLIREGRL